MNDDVMLEFLSKGLINVGGDDDKLEHLRQTAADLAAILEQTPAKACAFSLVAFDPYVSVNDPTIVEVENALRGRWQTYVNTFDKTPVTVFRSMLLAALVSACKRNESVAAAFVAAARNILPFMEVGEERGIWANVVGGIERRVEERAEREWSTPSEISVPSIRLKPAATDEVRVSSKGVNATSLRQKLTAAAGPKYNSPNQGVLNTEGNPYWQHNDPANWNYEFGRRAAQTLADAIKQMIGGLSVEGIDLQSFTKETARTLSAHLTKTLQAVSTASAGLQRRTNLLWWKEALFSPTARISYRAMTSHDAAALMAFDMYQQIPTFSPSSVAAFLRETVLTLPTLNEDETVPIRELMEKTGKAELLSPLRTEAAQLVSAPEGRCSVLAMIGNLDAMHQLDDSGFRDRVGLNQDTELTLPDWSVWIFRELQAARAAAEASAMKRPAARKRAPRK